MGRIIVVYQAQEPEHQPKQFDDKVHTKLSQKPSSCNNYTSVTHLGISVTNGILVPIRFLF